MSESTSASGSGPTPPARGRGKSRGGLGKYLRARGRGRGRGRPAEFSQRLVLEDEQDVELDEEEASALQARYSSRGLGSNAFRYEEPEPDPEEEPEPEVDLTGFLARQKAALDVREEETPSKPHNVPNNSTRSEADAVDRDLEKMMNDARIGAPQGSQTRKGNKQVLEWDQQMEEMQREKSAADAMRDLKTRLQGSKQLRSSPMSLATLTKRKDSEPKVDMRSVKGGPDDPESFLDDLLG